MSPGARFRQALPTSFVIHLASLGLAALPAFFGMLSIRSLTQAYPQGDSILNEPGSGTLLLTIGAWSDGALHPQLTVSFLLGAAVLTVVLNPWLFMSWCSAMHPPADTQPPSSPWRRGLGLYLPAAATTAVMAPLLALPAGAAALLWHLPHVLPATRLFLALSAGGTLFILWCLLHDLARTQLIATPSPFRAIRASLRHVRAGILASFAIWMGLYTTASLLANMLGYWLDGPTILQSAIAVTLGQSLLFARTMARARWLASSAHLVTPANEAGSDLNRNPEGLTDPEVLR